MTTTFAKKSRPDGTDRLKRWTTAEFDRLVDSGILEEGSETYLWEGQIVEPMSEYQPHRNAFWNLVGLLNALFPTDDWTVDGNGPLPLEDGFKPQPDAIVAKGPRSRYRVAPPAPADVALLIEVSDSTYPRDSGERLRKYATAGIALYWIVNVPDQRVEVYEDAQPSDLGPWTYRKRTDHGLNQSIPIHLSHDGAEVVAEIAVIDILRDSLDRPEPQDPI